MIMQALRDQISERRGCVRVALRAANNAERFAAGLLLVGLPVAVVTLVVWAVALVSG